MTFTVLYNAARTKRWHTHDMLKEQNLADHQWGVALIVMTIMPGRYNLLKAALTHDLGEAVTGDVPYTGKKMYPEIKRLTEQAEYEFAVRYGTATSLTAEDAAILAWADMLEAYLHAKREVSLGNTTMKYVVDKALEALISMGSPNKIAYELLKEVT